MEQQDKTVIDGLFDRLRQAEAGAGPRDGAAEDYIRQQLARQPAAPYYMAQAIVVQEHALNALKARVDELEHDLAQRPAAGGGGFLGGLFGAAPAQAPRSTSMAPQAMAPFQQAPRGSFLGGAVQTAAGVAGGLLLGTMIAGMFAGDAEAASAPAAAPEAEPEPEPETEAGGGLFGGFFGGGEDDEL